MELIIAYMKDTDFRDTHASDNVLITPQLNSVVSTINPMRRPSSPVNNQYRQLMRSAQLSDTELSFQFCAVVYKNVYIFTYDRLAQAYNQSDSRVFSREG